MIGSAEYHATGSYHAAAVAALLVGVVAGAAALRRRRASVTDRTPSTWSVGRTAWLGTWSCVLVLGLTAFGAVLTTGTLNGYPLMVHTVAGGALTAVLAVFGLTCAGARRSGFARITFWAVLLLGLSAGVSMLASMLPWFETVVLEYLLDVHRWSGLGMFVATAVHVSLVDGSRA